MSEDIVEKLLEFAPITVEERRAAARKIHHLRAELAAEREKANEWHQDFLVAVELRNKTMAERDALRALLREAREVMFGSAVCISEQGFNDDAEREMLARIDAALKGDDRE